MLMLVKEAAAITGGLSKPSKMPCPGYSLPAAACKIGSLLAKKLGTACSGCYALKGFYMFPSTQRAMEKRLVAIRHEKWVEAMSLLINRYSAKSGYFRWHDSGDIQDKEHLSRIAEVCRQTPTIRHWLPTRENRIVREFAKSHKIPENLVIRMSAPLVDRGLKKPANGLPFSTIHSKEDMFKEAHLCPARQQGNICGDCRACWRKDIPHVSYHLH
jgi:hypothetical protein